MTPPLSPFCRALPQRRKCFGGNGVAGIFFGRDFVSDQNREHPVGRRGVVRHVGKQKEEVLTVTVCTQIIRQGVIVECPARSGRGRDFEIFADGKFFQTFRDINHPQSEAEIGTQSQREGLQGGFYRIQDDTQLCPFGHAARKVNNENDIACSDLAWHRSLRVSS